MDDVVASESSLLERARQFDRHALAKIYDLYSPGLYRYALRLLGDDQLAEECVAETFSRFLYALRDKRGPRDYLQAYLYRVAHNWIVDFYRHNPPLDALEEGDSVAKDDPESAVDKNLQSARLRRAVLHLTPAQQQVILLKYVEGWENEAIAKALHKPVGAVKSLQHRALSRLAQLMSEEG